MSVQSELNRINNAKTAITNAIKNKGVTVPSTAKIGDLASLISSIPTGGGSLDTCTIIFDLASYYTDGGDIAVIYTDATGATVEGTLPEGDSAYELTVACNSLFYMSGTDLYMSGTVALSYLVSYRGKGVYRVTANTGTFNVLFDNS